MGSKIYMITDTHFGVYSAHNLNKWMDIQFGFFEKLFIPYLKENVKEGDILVHLGDLFDDRDSVPIIIMNRVQELLSELSDIIPIHLMVGNHDLWNKGDNSINSPKVYKWIPNVNIYEKTTTMEFEGKKLVFMPWIEHRSNMIKELQSTPGDYLFCHSDLNGCRMHLSSVAHRNKSKINVSEFSGYNRVFSGHIHIRQVNENFEFIGAPYQMDRNDFNDTKGFTILDVSSGETEFVENTISPTFKKVHIKTEDDIAMLKFVDTDKHFVDLTINNSVIIGQRKNKKLLEQVLTDKRFSKVEYHNDLAKKKEDIKTLNEDTNIDTIKINDFGKLVVEYTSEIDFGSDAINNGTLAELSKILDIYHKTHKFDGE